VSGYRTSNYDPTHYERAGRPMRPFNWVQWTGVALEVAALGIYLVFLAGEIGWIRPLIGNPAVATALMFPGIFLINSRRHPYVDEAPEQRARNRRMLLITVAIVAVILGAATVIAFTGA
jgi:hypothetical protein